jgi:hypothetical protein
VFVKTEVNEPGEAEIPPIFPSGAAVADGSISVLARLDIYAKELPPTTPPTHARVIMPAGVLRAAVTTLVPGVALSTSKIDVSYMNVRRCPVPH